MWKDGKSVTEHVEVPAHMYFDCVAMIHLPDAENYRVTIATGTAKGYKLVSENRAFAMKLCLLLQDSDVNWNMVWPHAPFNNDALKIKRVLKQWREWCTDVGSATSL
jgi:hypothetical protein